MTQRLDDLKDDRVMRGCVGDVEFALAHHMFRQFPCCQFAINFEVADGNVGDLALFEEAVADEIADPLSLFVRKQADSGINMCQVVFRLSNLALIGVDPAMDLRALVL